MARLNIRMKYLFAATALVLLTTAGCSGGGGSSTTTPPPVQIHNQWTWLAGANVGEQPGTYGTQGVPAAGNTPGARESAACWVDSSGSLWVLGGAASPSQTSDNFFNDLWKFSAGANGPG
jgi:hypothetical protein